MQLFWPFPQNKSHLSLVRKATSRCSCQIRYMASHKIASLLMPQTKYKTRHNYQDIKVSISRDWKVGNFLISYI